MDAFLPFWAECPGDRAPQSPLPPQGRPQGHRFQFAKKTSVARLHFGPEFFAIGLPNRCDSQRLRIQRKNPQLVTRDPRHVVYRQKTGVLTPERGSGTKGRHPRIEDFPITPADFDALSCIPAFSRVRLETPEQKTPVRGARNHRRFPVWQIRLLSH